MDLKVTDLTINEFHRTKNLLAEHRSELEASLKKYPLVVVFAGYRYVLENMEEFESMVGDIEKAIAEYELEPLSVEDYQTL